MVFSIIGCSENFLSTKNFISPTLIVRLPVICLLSCVTFSPVFVLSSHVQTPWRLLRLTDFISIWLLSNTESGTSLGPDSTVLGRCLLRDTQEETKHTRKLIYESINSCLLTTSVQVEWRVLSLFRLVRCPFGFCLLLFVLSTSAECSRVSFLDF